ncbi:MAG: hypothetical protein HYR55_11300 [Acidobacteria bacterium]|nr:hypothetical protein [Acidobacteriota bacterium]MBI3655049.1 hypothetical protein [Acidobacteriota bacterium]
MKDPGRELDALERHRGGRTGEANADAHPQSLLIHHEVMVLITKLTAVSMADPGSGFTLPSLIGNGGSAR